MNPIKHESNNERTKSSMNRIFVQLFATCADISTKLIFMWNSEKLVRVAVTREIKSIAVRKCNSDLHYEAHSTKLNSDCHFVHLRKLPFATDNDGCQASATFQLVWGTRVMSHGRKGRVWMLRFLLHCLVLEVICLSTLNAATRMERIAALSAKSNAAACCLALESFLSFKQQKKTMAYPIWILCVLLEKYSET